MKVDAAPSAKPGHDARLEKLGIRSRLDLVLHLPLRYEDETRLTALKDVRPGEPALVEAEVVEAKVEYRGRRTLVAKLTDGERELWVRFLHFYPSQVKQFQEGRRVRLFGEVRPGFFGDEMVHPRYRIVGKDAPLPESLTPVYPTTAPTPACCASSRSIRRSRRRWPSARSCGCAAKSKAASWGGR